MTKTEVAPKSLCLNDIRIFRDGELLLELNVEVRPGEITTIMGPSGSGKSTVLSLISGFLPSNFSFEGQVMLDGVDIYQLPPSKRQIGLMFQDPLLFPHLNVEDNLMFGLTAEGSKAERCELVAKALEAVNMAELGARDPMTLSGGQQSRIALVRVLLSNPKALLLDEPFSSLDSGLRNKVRNFVYQQARAKQLPTLLVTHDQDDAALIDGKIIKL